MTERKFETHTDAKAGRVRMRLWGYWSDQEFEVYHDAMLAIIADLKRTGKPWVALLDVRQSPPQSAHTQKGRQEILERARAGGMRRIAYVTESVLTSQQMRRVNEGAGTQAAFFDDEAAALAWLTGA